MRDAIATLKALEGDLLVALDAEDTGAVTALVAARGEALDALRRAFDASAPAERQRYLPDLKRLTEGDAILGARCRALRDTMRARLQDHDARPVARPQPVISGVLDRQA